MTLLASFEGFPHCQAAHQYASDVVSGKISTCQNVILACQRQLDDLEREDFAYEFDPSKGERVVEFIELLPHTKGKWMREGKSLVLEPWQKFAICCIFGWVRKSDGFRRFREADIFVPRKNGKSALAAGIAVYMFAADNEPGSEVYCGATNEKQAFEVFKPAKIMVQKRQGLRDRFGIEVNARNLVITSDGSKFEPVIGNPGDGSSPHCWIVDEYHEHADSQQVDTAITGMGAREQPLLLVITTAGTDTSSPCYDRMRDMEKILAGVETGDDTEQKFILLYGIDKDDDWQDFGILEKANPNFGVSIGEDFLRTQQLGAIRKASNQNKFLIKHLNKWVNAKEAWLSASAWQNCGDNDLYEGDFESHQMIGALDLASKRDICSFIRCYYEDKKDGRHYYIFGDHFLPGDRIADDDANHSYQSWVHDEYLTIAGEAETDLDEVEELVIDYLEVGNVREITYDPWKATQMAQRLEKQGSASIVEFKQNAMMMSPAMDEVEAAIYAGRLHHDNCPIMQWMSGNVVVKPYKTDYKTPTKEKEHLKIDGMVALIMAVGRAMYDGESDASIYEDRGPRSL